MPPTTTDDTDDRAVLSGLTASDRHRLLADERRRLILDDLPNRAGAIELEELAEEIVAREETSHVDREAAVESACVALHHRHLPLLDDFDVLDYDPTSNLIRL